MSTKQTNKPQTQVFQPEQKTPGYYTTTDGRR